MKSYMVDEDVSNCRVVVPFIQSFLQCCTELNMQSCQFLQIKEYSFYLFLGQRGLKRTDYLLVLEIKNMLINLCYEKIAIKNSHTFTTLVSFSTNFSSVSTISITIFFRVLICLSINSNSDKKENISILI
mgnify:CR=1 FL=1